MTTSATFSSNVDPRCPTCRGVGIRWKALVASLAVVEAFPTLHGFGDRLKGTASTICRTCGGDGRSTPTLIRGPMQRA